MQRRPPSLKARAVALLARREHSRVELRAKLLAAARPDRSPGPVMTHNLDTAQDPDPALLQAEVEALLDWLQAHHYLSDARFAESRIHARAPRHGQARIRMELARHGVALEAEAGRRLRETELARAQAVWQRKFGQAPGDARERARQMRFLAGRGFAAEVIWRVVAGADLEDEGG
jgi:regulatory protein